MTLDDRLRDLGTHLDLDEPSLADSVNAMLDETPTRPSGSRVLRVAAVLLVALVAVTVAVPSSRRVVAGWFGFDGVTIERDPSLAPAPTADAVQDAAASGAGTTVNGMDVLVSSFPGRIESDALMKTIGDGTDIVRVDVAGAAGVWINGDPHEMAFRSGSGEFVVQRFAGNTLLWQDGAVIRRLEGFESVTAAIAYASTIND